MAKTVNGCYPYNMYIVDPSWSGFNYTTTNAGGTTTYTTLAPNQANPILVAGVDTRDRGDPVGSSTLRTDTINAALANGSVRVLASGFIDARSWGLDEVVYPNYFINTTTSNKLTLEAGSSIYLHSYRLNLPNGTLELLAGTTISQSGPTTGGAIYANTLILGKSNVVGADVYATPPSVTLTAASNYISNIQASNISSLSFSNNQAL